MRKTEVNELAINEQITQDRKVRSREWNVCQESVQVLEAVFKTRVAEQELC